jgi:predicted nucleic acid-binding Zn ribbon protein
MKKNASSFVPIGTVLGDALKIWRRDASRDLQRVFGSWNQVAGPAIAENARPAAYREQVLVIHVNSSVWVHQLQFLKAELIEKLNEALEDRLVRDIKFKVGTV